MIRLYVPNDLEEAKEIPLSERQSHYLQKVMRLRDGDSIHLFNGREGEWEGPIVHHKKTTHLKLTRQTRPQRDEGDMWLLFSPIKPKRQEFLIEKATELGVSCLWPVRMQRTNAFIKPEKELAHIVESAEQCRRLTLPILKPLTSLSEMLKTWPKDRTLFFGDETLGAPSLAQIALDPRTPCALLIGPEGGFSQEEFALLQAHPNVQGITLSPNILRAETAAVVGLAGLQTLLNG